MKPALPLIVSLAFVLTAHAQGYLSERNDAPEGPKVQSPRAADNSKPRRFFVGRQNRGRTIDAYAEECLRKIAGTVNLNYPEEAKNRLYGSVLMTIELLPGGEIQEPRIERSSGYPVLDNALKRAAEVASPCSPFPAELAERADVLHITRTYSFMRGDDSIVAERMVYDGTSVAALEPPLTAPSCYEARGKGVSNFPPHYPPSSRRAGEEGTITLRVLIDPLGYPEIVELHASSGFENLDKAAIAAVTEWCFYPANRDGKPVSSWQQVPISFRIEPAESVPAEASARKQAWIQAISQRIVSNLAVPRNTHVDARARFRVSQLPDGTILEVFLTSSSGFLPLDEAIERAIWKASPLPKPSDPEDFERVIDMTFMPFCGDSGTAENPGACARGIVARSKHSKAPNQQTAASSQKSSTLNSDWMDVVRGQVRSNFLITRNTPANIRAIVSVVQRPDGAVEKVQVKSSSGFTPFDEAAERAIFRSSPFPALGPRFFEPNFELTFVCDSPLPGVSESVGKCLQRDVEVR